MSTAELVATQLPYLRRYARALTGHQGAGDNYVMATLEALLSEPRSFERPSDAKVEVFRAFTKIWNSISVNTAADPVTVAPSPDERLNQLTALPRQAFLLVSLEGFSEEEAARILDVDVSRVRTLIDAAGRELAAEIATDVLIIEDEPLIAMDLEQLVETLGHKVIGIARTRDEAVKFADKTPGIILADVQLADGSSGLDAVNELLKHFEVPIVCITAYPERFLTGERPEPAFLIAKPFRPAHVSAVISQALFFQTNARRPGARAAERARSASA